MDGITMTAEELERIQRELHELESTGRSRIAARIRTAREWGDLKENGEYHAAKEDQAHLETRIQRLQGRLRNALVVEESDEVDVFGFGRTAEVLDEGTGITHRWKIVGSTESDLSTGLLSAESPVAKALLGRSAGECVEVTTPRGLRRLRINRLL